MKKDPVLALKELGFTLPGVTVPGGRYLSVNVRGNIAYVSVQFPILNDQFLYQGRLGTDVSTKDGYQAMELCALNLLAHVDKKVGLKNILGLNHIDAFYQSGPDWDHAPEVVDGASNLFVNVLGEKGAHSRAIFGVEKLPRNFCVGLTATLTTGKQFWRGLDPFGYGTR